MGPKVGGEVLHLVYSIVQAPGAPVPVKVDDGAGGLGEFPVEEVFAVGVVVQVWVSLWGDQVPAAQEEAIGGGEVDVSGVWEREGEGLEVG